MSAPVNAFTVDLEDWFQGLTSTNPLVDQWPIFESRVVPATETLLSILQAHQVKATFFVLGYVADHHPHLIERIHAAGHEIGIHGYHHRRVSQLSPREFAVEVTRSTEAVTRVTGERPWGHRAPYFSFDATTTWAFTVLQDHGYRYDSSIFPARSLIYGYPAAPRFPHRPHGTDLLEFPVATVRLGGVNWPVGGGFYHRLLPYGLIKQAIMRLNRQGEAAILYIHPWELDVDQRYDRVTFRERITHYYGRRRLSAKLHRLFSDFQFGSLSTLFDQITAERHHDRDYATK